MTMHDAGSEFPAPRNCPRGLHHITVWQKIPGDRALVLPVLYATSGDSADAALVPAGALLDLSLIHI